MKLPYADKAFVDLNKLRDYCLSLEHPRGKHKARVFESSLGMYSEHAENLRTLILKNVLDAECQKGRRDQYGERYIVDFTLYFQERSAEVRTAWMIRAAEKFPRLTTCYIK